MISIDLHEWPTLSVALYKGEVNDYTTTVAEDICKKFKGSEVVQVPYDGYFMLRLCARLVYSEDGRTLEAMEVISVSDGATDLIMFFRVVPDKEEIACSRTQDPANKNMKSSNPKDLAAVSRVPMHLWPGAATIHGSVALNEGMHKYGYYNWRRDGVSIMTYIGALNRHMYRFIEGQYYDSESGGTNLGHMLACIAIIVDAFESGKVIDDRPISNIDPDHLLDSLEDKVAKANKRLEELGLDPDHCYRYKIAEGEDVSE